MFFLWVGGVGVGGWVKPRSAARILTAFKGVCTPPRGVGGGGGAGGHLGAVTRSPRCFFFQIGELQLRGLKYGVHFAVFFLFWVVFFLVFVHCCCWVVPVCLALPVVPFIFSYFCCCVDFCSYCCVLSFIFCHFCFSLFFLVFCLPFC